MLEIVEFLPEHVEPALDLWRKTEHIGLNDVDDQPSELTEFLKRNVGCSFVALEGNQLVGACLCGHDLRRASIYHLAVDSEFRRSGLGRELVAASLSALRAIGVTKCHAFVFRENPYAEQFWQAEGWTLREELFMFSVPI